MAASDASSHGPADPPPSGREMGLSRQDALLVGLTFTAGLVDAVSYLGLGQIFTANMTGNIVFLALAVGEGKLFLGIRSLGALIGFSLGAFAAGRMLGRRSARLVWPPRVTAVLAGELALYAVFGIGWWLTNGQPTSALLYLLIGASSVGMGLQNAAARHLAVPGYTTTVVTTALTGLMAEFAALGMSGPEPRRWMLALSSLFAGAALGAASMVYARALAPVLILVLLMAICASAYLGGSGTPEPPAGPTPTPTAPPVG
jgi:uncharacterized membrane protein YoaK (UPF0700 family)